MSKTFIVQVNKISEHLPRAARRIIVNVDCLKTCNISTGDLVALSCATPAGSRSIERFAVGVIWPSLDITKDSILVSSSLLLTAGLSTGDGARLIPLSSLPSTGFPSLQNIKDAKSLCLHEVKSYKNSSNLRVTPPSHKTCRDWLNLAARELLVDLRYILNNQVIEISYEGQSRRFVVGDITGKMPGSIDDQLLQEISGLSIVSPQLWTVGWDCVVSFEGKDEAKGSTLEHDDHRGKVEVLVDQPAHNAYSSVGGLDQQIGIVRDLLEIPLMRPELFRYFGLKPPRGILLQGPPGTGKTHLARAIALATEASVLIINGPELSSAYHGETESKLRDVFIQARKKSPCIVVLDEIDALVPRREDGGGGEVEKRVVATLLTIMDGMGSEHEDDSRVVVIGTTNRPNAIDPALRRPGRFDREIEIGVPNAEARFSILNVLLANTPHNISKDDLRSIAGRMYGYVGADIAAVVREAGTLSIKKWLESTVGIVDSQPHSVPERLKLDLVDLVAAVPSVRPSAMRSLFIDAPPVYYSDIGGQASVIQKLREVVEWPLMHPEAFRRLGVRPPKGLLLYGPPGCSKTILARACACESGVNFVAVKGPELLNKFLGESERAVREIFRKARATSPSIVFFDEIDALASARASDNDHISYDGTLTTLLNEMDGVEELTGVTIIGATNRPETMDSALMRPGRFDRILWVGPPDLVGREDILGIKTRGMSVGADFDVRAIAELTEGCSGAEISSLCQEAAIMTMQRDLKASYVPQEAFVDAAMSVRRQITAKMLERFKQWSQSCNLR